MFFLDVRVDVAFMTGIYWSDSKLVNNRAPCRLEIFPGNKKQLGLVTVETITLVE